MAKIRATYERNYTVIANSCVKNPNLSLKAKGLMLVLWSLPDGWNFSIDGLTSMMKEGRDAISAAVKELEAEGYVTRKQLRKNNGRADGNEWILRDMPSTENTTSENPRSGNPEQLSTKELSKEIKESKDIQDSACTNFRSCVDEIVGYLNSLAMTSYRPTTPKTQAMIRARMNEGFTVEDFKKVIAFKVMKWTNTDFAPYLRPDTLFGTKFEGYLNEAERCLAEQRGEVNVRALFKQFCDSYRFSGMAYRLNDDNSVTNLTMKRTMPFKEWVNAI